MDKIKEIILNNIKEKEEFNEQALYILNKLSDIFTFKKEDKIISKLDLVFKLNETIKNKKLNSKIELENYLISFIKDFKIEKN